MDVPGKKKRSALSWGITERNRYNSSSRKESYLKRPKFSQKDQNVTVTDWKLLAGSFFYLSPRALPSVFSSITVSEGFVVRALSIS